MENRPWQNWDKENVANVIHDFWISKKPEDELKEITVNDIKKGNTYKKIIFRRL